MILVIDTNAYSAFCQGNASVIGYLEKADEVIVPSIVAGELISGFLQGTRWDQNWRNFQEFLKQPGIRLQDPGMSGAEQYGLMVKSLKKAGTPVPTNDVWIAAIALSQGAGVLTRDSHFDHFPGLFVVGY